MTGEQLAGAVEDECRRLGLPCWRFRADKRIRAGWVDLVILGLGGALFIECKGQREHRRPAQVTAGYLLEANGISYRVWRPADWTSGLIAGDLRRLG